MGDKKENTMMKLKGINPNLFWAGLTIYLLMMTYMIWGNYDALYILYGTYIVIGLYYHISTFEVRVREEDQEEGEK